jgi:hypothetical protein
MKNSIAVSKGFMVSSAVVLSLMTGALASAQAQTNNLRIGVYDSRAVAAAYVNSPEFKDMLKTVQADYDKAKAAKDEKRTNEIRRRMELQQRWVHEQVFSTGSTASIVAKIKGALPGVAKKKGVQAIVSKWELNYQGPDVELVDVTEDLAALFNPSDKEQKWRGILKHAPVPMDQADD